MKTTFRFALIFCLVASLLAFPSLALADQSQPEDPPPPGFELVEGAPMYPASDAQPEINELPAPAASTRYLTLVGLDFHPTTSDLTYSSTNGGLYPLTLSSSFGFTAPFNLPTGTTVTGITFFVVDNSIDTDVALGVYRYDPTSNTSQAISITSTAGTALGIQTISLPGSAFTLDNSTYAYRLRAEFHATGGSQILYGARIAYAPPTTPTSPDYVSMAGADFRSSSSNMTYSALGGTLYATAIETSFYFKTRLDLPQGATINEVQWFLVDNNAAGSFNLRIHSHEPASDNFGMILDPASPGNSAGIQVVTAAVSIPVDSMHKSYTIGFSPSEAATSLRIVGARVRYTPPTTVDPSVARVKTFSGNDFYPSGTSLTYRASGGKLYALALSSGRSFQASLNLPADVRIDKITFYYIDTSAQDFLFAGRYYYPQTGSYSDPVTGNSTGNAPGIRSLVFANTGGVMGVMDPSTMVSRLRVEPGAAGPVEHLLVGATVEYSIPKVFLPFVNRE